MDSGDYVFFPLLLCVIACAILLLRCPAGLAITRRRRLLLVLALFAEEPAEEALELGGAPAPCCRANMVRFRV